MSNHALVSASSVVTAGLCKWCTQHALSRFHHPLPAVASHPTYAMLRALGNKIGLHEVRSRWRTRVPRVPVPRQRVERAGMPLTHRSCRCSQVLVKTWFEQRWAEEDEERAAQQEGQPATGS